MDSRLRGNDKKGCGNDRVEAGMTGGEGFTPTLILPPQGGGNMSNDRKR